MARKRRGRSEGAVYQRADGQWAASISMGYGDNGKRKRKVVYGKSKAEVQEKLRQLQTAADRGSLPDAGALTVAHFLAHWLEAIKPTVATHTWLAYDRDVRRYITPHAGRLQLAKLTALHVEKMYADLAAAGVSPAMQRKAGVTLSVALTHAVKRRLVPHNVAKDVKKPRHEKKEILPLDPDQWGRFMEAARQDRLYALYVLWVDSCAREGELFALDWSDVDFAGGAVTITKTLEETKGKLRVKDVKTKKSRRRIALSPFTMEALAEHRAAMLAEGHYAPDKPVFCAPEGGWLRESNAQRRSFQPIVDRANAKLAKEAEEAGTAPTTLPPLRPYDLRHTGATLLLLAGEPAKVVSERLGHSTITLTLDTYSHVLPGMQEKAASKMDAIFRAAAADRQAGAG